MKKNTVRGYPSPVMAYLDQFSKAELIEALQLTLWEISDLADDPDAYKDADQRMVSLVKALAGGNLTQGKREPFQVRMDGHTGWTTSFSKKTLKKEGVEVL
jgi:hypothetical protein